MPSITGQPAIDVAIGLFFAFFLLSVLCSAINETIATVLAWRSQTLLAALRSMLAEGASVNERDRQPAGQATAATSAEPPPAAAADSDLLNRLLDHPLVRAQTDETARHRLRRSVPSYLTSRSFALALLDTLAPPPEGADSHDVIRKLRDEVATIANPQIKQVLTSALATAGGDVAKVRTSVEHWFDATMDRASGWYKRKTLWLTWATAALATLALNADAGQMASAMWHDDALRAAVVAQAQKAAQDGNTTDVGGKGTSLSEAVSNVKALGLPLGWSFHKGDPRWPDTPGGFLGKLAGLLATIVALTLGAPFWFDLLGKVSRIRGTGKPERPGAA